VNSVGGWASAITLWGFAAYRFNASPYAVSVTIVCWAAPPAILSVLAGVLVDKVGPRAALVAGYLAAAAAALAMAAAGSLAELDVAAAGYGIARAVSGPAANALPPHVVADGDLLAANALLGAAASVGQVAGAAAASAALALSGFPGAFVLDAVTYLIGAAVVASLPLPAHAPKGRAADWTEERGSRRRPERRGKEAGPAARRRKTSTAGPAARRRKTSTAGPAARRRKTSTAGPAARRRKTSTALVVRDPQLRRLTLLSAAVAFTSAAFLVVEPLYARHVLHRPPSQFVLFEAAAGAGGILAGLAVSRIGTRLAGMRVTALSAACYGLAASVFAGTSVVSVAYLGAFVWGITGMVFGVASLTTIQQTAPVDVHGRVMGVMAAIQSWVETGGLPLGGAMLAVLGVRAGAIALAAVSIFTGLICLSRGQPCARGR
jgi:MFS family permease